MPQMYLKNINLNTQFEAAYTTCMNKKKILSLYRRIINVGKHWTALDPSNTSKESKDILLEARNRFKENKCVCLYFYSITIRIFDGIL